MKDKRPDSDADGTQIRQKPNEDKTIIRKVKDDTGIPKNRSKDPGGAETIIRQDEADPDTTLLREPAGVVDADATTLREPQPGEISGSGADESDAATTMRTVAANAETPTLINSPSLGPDTTYIASAGKAIESKGNTEVGRLLKNRFVLEQKKIAGEEASIAVKQANGGRVEEPS